MTEKGETILCGVLYVYLCENEMRFWVLWFTVSLHSVTLVMDQ